MISRCSQVPGTPLRCLGSQSSGFCACPPLCEVLRLDQYNEKVDLFGLGSSLYFAVSLASASTADIDVVPRGGAREFKTAVTVVMRTRVGFFPLLERLSREASRSAQ